MAKRDPDGSSLLTSQEAGELLSAAVDHAGGTLVSWTLDHVDANPPVSTTATYQAVVQWPYGRRDELLGVSARAGGPWEADAGAEIFADGDREVAVWLYPQDPDLPGLARAAYPATMAQVCNDLGVFASPIGADDIDLQMIGYRPRRRAVLRVVERGSGKAVYVKVLRERLFAEIVHRHDLLRAAGLPVAAVLGTTPDHLMVLAELPGRPLARALFDKGDPCAAEELVRLLDSLPRSVTELERRPPWSDAVAHYAGVVAAALPELSGQLSWLTTMIEQGTGRLLPGDEPTHGDFHEGQIHVSDGAVSGLLDVDTIGPGHRVDDLACLVAHLSTIQRMNPAQQVKAHDLIRRWVPVFDERVEPTQLRLRAAGVVISLATGPFRGQEPDWEHETATMVASAEALVRQVS